MLDGKKYQLIGDKLQNLAFESNEKYIEKEGFSRLIKQGPTMFDSMKDAKKSQEESRVSPSNFKIKAIEIELNNILKGL